MLLLIAGVNLIALFIYMSFWFLRAKRTDHLDAVDTAWGGGYALIAVIDFILFSHALYMIIVAALVLVWAGRLAKHLFIRSSKRGGDDPRYRELATKWKGNFWVKAYTNVFLLQGALIWVVGLPITVVAATSSGNQADFSILAGIGIVVWIAGFVTESTADHQLQQFIESDHVKGANLDTGLWRYSRHPNYFGELLQWWAIGLIALSLPYGWIGLLGPAVLTFLIMKVSGIPPIENRRKNNAEYQEYKRRTSVLLPLPSRNRV